MNSGLWTCLWSVQSTYWSAVRNAQNKAVFILKAQWHQWDHSKLSDKNCQPEETLKWHDCFRELRAC